MMIGAFHELHPISPFARIRTTFRGAVRKALAALAKVWLT
jgi:hypothetical protein